MGGAGAAQSFDVDGFVAAVNNYARRHHHDRVDITEATGIAKSTLSEVLTRKRLTLYSAAKLAPYADLDLNKFIL